MSTALDKHDAQVCLALVRVDDRLLHGQVVLNWVRAVRPARILIVDDALAHDSLARDALMAASPPGIEVWIGETQEAVQELAGNRWRAARTMVLLRDPISARRLYEAGLGYRRLNVGAVGLAPGRVRVGRQVSLTRDEWEALRYLQQAGVDVTLQPLPSDHAVALARVRQPQDWA